MQEQRLAAVAAELPGRCELRQPSLEPLERLRDRDGGRVGVGLLREGDVDCHRHAAAMLAQKSFWSFIAAPMSPLIFSLPVM